MTTEAIAEIKPNFGPHSQPLVRVDNWLRQNPEYKSYRLARWFAGQYVFIGRRRCEEHEELLDKLEKADMTSENLKKLLFLRYDIYWHIDNHKGQIAERGCRGFERRSLETFLDVGVWLAERTEALVLKYQAEAISRHANGDGSLLLGFNEVLFDYAKDRDVKAYRR